MERELVNLCLHIAMECTEIENWSDSAQTWVHHFKFDAEQKVHYFKTNHIPANKAILLIMRLKEQW